MRFRRIFLILLLIWALSAVLRETGVISLEYYKSSMNSNISSTWRGMNLFTDLGLRSSTYSLTSEERACENEPVMATPVVADYKGTSWGDINSPFPKLKIEFSTFSHGMIWTPLFKSGDFSATAYRADQVMRYVRVGNQVQTKIFRPGGSFIVNGSFTIYGICSYRQSRKLILDQILSQLYQSGKAQIQTWN